LVRWRKAVKKPLTVQFREVNGSTETIRTKEGDLVAERGKHYIIKGVEGELYPVEIGIFRKTYEVPLDEEDQKRTLRQIGQEFLKAVQDAVDAVVFLGDFDRLKFLIEQFRIATDHMLLKDLKAKGLGEELTALCKKAGELRWVPNPHFEVCLKRGEPIPEGGCKACGDYALCSRGELIPEEQ